MPVRLGNRGRRKMSGAALPLLRFADSDALPGLLEVLRRRLVPAHFAIRCRMHDSELRRVQHHARGDEDLAFESPDVHALAHDRISCLREMHANLMRATRLELAPDERGGLAAIDDLDVCHRELPL